MTTEIEQLISEYRELLVQRRAANATPAVANKLFDRNHALYKRLRESEEGRRAIAALLDDPEVVVRLSASTHSLQWAPDRAIAVLQEIETEAGLEAMDAKYTLIAYRDGTLNLDW